MEPINGSNNKCVRELKLLDNRPKANAFSLGRAVVFVMHRTGIRAMPMRQTASVRVE